MKNSKKAWERYPELTHLSGVMKEAMERRRRLRQIRYMLFSLQNAENKGESLDSVPTLPHFPEFWLTQKAEYGIDPKGNKIAPIHRKTVLEMGGYKEFAKKWDVDEDLRVYLRHLSVWQEWNATLMRVAPVLGEGE